jgi:hypothetical protein
MVAFSFGLLVGLIGGLLLVSHWFSNRVMQVSTPTTPTHTHPSHDNQS